MPKRAAAKPHGKHVFTIIRNRQTLCQSACAILHSQQECMSDPVLLHPRQRLVVSSFFSLAILTGVQ